MARRQLTIAQGETMRLRFSLRENGVAVDLSNYTARMQIRAAYDSATTLLALATGGSGIVIDGTAGRVTIEASATQTAALPAPAAAVYDIELESPTGEVTRQLEGVARITPEVSR